GAQGDGQVQSGEADSQTQNQANGVQNQPDGTGTVQQVIVGQAKSPGQAQGQQQPQHIQTLQLAPGQTLQPIQAFQNPAQVLIRTPTLSPSGQITWQTLQLPSGVSLQGGLARPCLMSDAGPGGQRDPRGERRSGLPERGSPDSERRPDQPRLWGTDGQHRRPGGCRSSGAGVPLTITGLQGQPQGQDGVKVQSSPVTVAVGNVASGSSMSPEQLGSVQSSSEQDGPPNKSPPRRLLLSKLQGRRGQ
ncbi:unnamed protein product, partial [Tetraodon nigroviridis]